MTFSYSFFTVQFYGIFFWWISVGFCAEFRDFVSFSSDVDGSRTHFDGDYHCSASGAMYRKNIAKCDNGDTTVFYDFTVVS